MFDVDVPNGPVLMESRTTAPGSEVGGAASVAPPAAGVASPAGWHWHPLKPCNAAPALVLPSHLPHSWPPNSTSCQLVTCDSPAGRLGLSVCYDLRFPELYQTLTWHMGASVLLVPSAFTKVTGAAHWEVLLRARAIECQAYVIAAAQAGRHNEKRESYGHSLIIDPWGSIIARLPDPLATGIAVADLDGEAMAGVRAKMPIQEHRERGRALLAQGGQQ